MKITAGTWNQENKSIYKAEPKADQQQEEKEEILAYAKEETPNTPWGNVAGQTPGASQSNGKIKASMPDDQVGQLASQLANSETKFDVQQVSSKAMRALASLRMSSALSEGKDKQKITQMIRRMEKLLKRVRTKMKQLTKEEQLENRQKRAEEKKQEQEARELRDELHTKRTKRRRDERNYALKETAQDNREASAANQFLPTAGTGSPSFPSTISVDAISAAGSVDAVAVSAESVSLDITV